MTQDISLLGLPTKYSHMQQKRARNLQGGSQWHGVLAQTQQDWDLGPPAILGPSCSYSPARADGALRAQGWHQGPLLRCSFTPEHLLSTCCMLGEKQRQDSIHWDLGDWGAAEGGQRLLTTSASPGSGVENILPAKSFCQDFKK